MDAFRVWAEIDLDALAHNLEVIRRRAGAGVRVMLVVKADAYGHGAVAIAHHAVRCGIGALGVGTSGEALELRRAGIRLPILVLGTVVDDELSACLRHGVHIGLHSSDRRESLQELARRMGIVARVHLNVDTGMGRLGVLPARALPLLDEIQASSHLELAGIMTHVSSPDGALDATTQGQLDAFERVLRETHARGYSPGWVHVANSACIFTGLGGRFDTVRPGIAAYGALPAHLPGADELRPVLALRSQVVFLKDVPAGTPIGYGSTWQAPSATRIATLSSGYNDGVSARLGRDGRRAPARAPSPDRRPGLDGLHDGRRRPPAGRRGRGRGDADRPGRRGGDPARGGRPPLRDALVRGELLGGQAGVAGLRGRRGRAHPPPAARGERPWRRTWRDGLRRPRTHAGQD